jgi:hypothetical protein
MGIYQSIYYVYQYLDEKGDRDVAFCGNEKFHGIYFKTVDAFLSILYDLCVCVCVARMLTRKVKLSLENSCHCLSYLTPFCECRIVLSVEGSGS